MRELIFKQFPKESPYKIERAPIATSVCARISAMTLEHGLHYLSSWDKEMAKARNGVNPGEWLFHEFMMFQGAEGVDGLWIPEFGYRVDIDAMFISLDLLCPVHDFPNRILLTQAFMHFRLNLDGIYEYHIRRSADFPTDPPYPWEICVDRRTGACLRKVAASIGGYHFDIHGLLPGVVITAIHQYLESDDPAFHRSLWPKNPKSYLQGLTGGMELDF
ncbi:MAG: hypothetical protein UX31_C0015G0014 [Candidatus Nomurabacteria bacterium GW2011_GWA1_46_11]|uniref:Uncharacterized protein n=1 Tax=Candidatus Nomurabacteria bacterium GW2011_GWA1_46_11 TaxID=1618732 RepID=A0A0G1QV75_9BACT|nr:MAG: hypothetical protein UW69_C0024G0009 [Microgenomates group bacterium GW2011_GWA2_44_7]KKT77405.1 MAG: hypothetical protein UW73_C0021G0038 [Microgenomates group bacterium GW2011_GWB1_44_8]KKU21688.1 MAG: hypothetical protein UX31_C0015G0014 [Candidatus Nomurabacteria bacterium GW2011_GWA1_46_11]